MMTESDILYPVILAVPQSARKLPPKSRVKFLSQHARKALAISARKSNMRLGELLKDDNGKPLPVDGVYWSLTHKTGYVGAVASFSTIGIDLEKIQPRRTRALFQKTAAPDEWALCRNKSWGVFHRYWTAKEAVLKAGGIGLKDLSRCRVTKIIDPYNLVIQYDERSWPVEHCYFSGHIASIVKTADRIEWTRLSGPGISLAP